MRSSRIRSPQVVIAWAILTFIVLCSVDGSAQIRFTDRRVDHSYFGSTSHFGGHVGFSSWGRPSYFRHRGSHFSLSLGFGFGSYGYGYPYAYYAPTYYWPSYYDSAYYVAPDRPTVIYNVYPDTDLRYSNRVEATPLPRRESTSGEENDYYLYRRPIPKPEPALKSAVEDIEDAFRTGDTALLDKHLRKSDSILILSGDRIARRVTGDEYLQMTRQAFSEMKTVSYKLSSIEPGPGSAWRASGTHVVRMGDGAQKTYGVQFILRKSGDSWLIDEVGGELNASPPK